MRKGIFVCGIVILLAIVFVYMTQGPKVLQTSGKVVDIDLRNLTFVVAPKTDEMIRLIIDEKTLVNKAEKRSAITEIKRGSQVTVTYQKGWGKKIAKFINIQEPPKPPSAKRKK